LSGVLFQVGADSRLVTLQCLKVIRPRRIG
jgi:hypothetical protein